MNKTLKSTLFVVLAALLLGTAFLVDPSGNVLNSANASEPDGHTPWITPINVTQSGSYDNYPALGVAPNGAATVYWGRATEDRGIMMHASTAGFNLPFASQIVHIGGVSLNGGNEVAADRLGRRHLVYWDWQPGETLKNWYARVGANGQIEIGSQMVPGSDDGGLRKLIGIGVDSNLTVHMAFARNNIYESFVYVTRTEAGQWSAPESIPAICGPSDLSFEVSTLGETMVIWKDCGQFGEGSDIYTGRRTGPNQWVVENISAACCLECANVSGAYLPELAATRDGGLRASWADGRCYPGGPTDIYYREWVPGTGWDNQPIVRVAANSGTSYYNSLAVDNNGDAHIVWADDTSSPFNYFRTFYVHGRGTNFSPVAIPFAQWAGNSWTREVSADYGADAFHVAFASNKGDPDKENYYSWTQVGGGTPTATPTNTSTPTPVPPPCPDETFTDVCPDDYFYEPVAALNEGGVINGYTTSPPCPNNLWINCFLPYNGATRAQMAKIVALAANLPSGGTAQAFTDVPPTNTFFPFVQSAYAAGVISGYNCGGLNEPCDSQNRPYFRPGAGVTRGQTSKMVVTAFGFSEPVPDAQWSFQDVAPGSAFHLFVERMFTRGIINGYPCGGANEPCVPPANRPYFRPNNPVTRGQTAKIVYESQLQASPTATNTMEPTATPTVEVTATATLEPTVEPTLEPTSTPTLAAGSPPGR
ncbi:MAG TPA: S-layer homology domain-containing protein [Chloroflexia bacterium]|nr:S-layer homology domain-containing protein [Chloroflexia bacterium]